MSVSLSNFEGYIAAHEACHRTVTVGSFNDLVANHPTSLTASLPAAIEALVRNIFDLDTPAHALITSANNEISGPNSVLDAETYSPHSFWGPDPATTSNWKLWTVRRAGTC